MSHHELHKAHKVVWLRAAVMGANDGIVSTASLIIGVAAAGTLHENIIVAGVAGLVSGAMSMAAGEYVSVSSQYDTEQADLELERASIEQNYDFERKELAEIYEDRGLDPSLAAKVAEQLMDHDALGAHARDEIGISPTFSARPVQAAFSSAGTFTVGASLPLLVAWLAAGEQLIASVAVASLASLAILGGLAARVGGASVRAGAIRVTFWSSLAMLVTAGVGHLFGISA
jgi:VIT1/CCC1 family predicted Fe2+/Mn2+ transporter